VLWGILGTIGTFGVYATATGIGQILLGQLMIAATSLPFLLKLRAIDSQEAAQRTLTATATIPRAAEPVGCGCGHGDGGGSSDG